VGSFAANTTYTLTVALADPADGTDPSEKSVGFQLLANGNVVASYANTSLTPGANFTDYTVTFDTAGNSSAVGQPITIALVYSYSGQYNRNAYFDNVRLTTAADGGSGNTSPSQVSLTTVANTTGIYTDGTSFATGSIDGDGYAYSASQLGSSLTVAGVTFTFGIANQPDVVKGVNQAAVTLTAAKYSTLEFSRLGAEWQSNVANLYGELRRRQQRDVHPKPQRLVYAAELFRRNNGPADRLPGYQLGWRR
jgi:hypothetical protein